MNCSSPSTSWTSLTLIFASAQSPFSSHVSVPVIPSKPSMDMKASRSPVRGMKVVPSSSKATSSMAWASMLYASNAWAWNTLIGASSWDTSV
jgi:hypothetical protein